MSRPSDPFDLQRFLDAQEAVIEIALSELRSGSKQSHWMWFVFPQIAGLGQSPISRRYAIRSLAEAKAFLAHPVLGRRLRDCVDALLAWAGNRGAAEIFGEVDSLKLRSSLTLFSVAATTDPRFDRALRAFFDSANSETLRRLKA